MKENDLNKGNVSCESIKGKKRIKPRCVLEMSVEKVPASGLCVGRNRKLSVSVNENFRTLSEIFLNCYDIAFQHFAGKREDQCCLLTLLPLLRWRQSCNR